MIIILVMGIIITMLIAGLITYKYEETRIMQEINNSSLQISERIAYNLFDAVWTYNEEVIERMVNLEMMSPIVLAIVVKDFKDNFWNGQIKNERNEIVKLASINKVQQAILESAFIKHKKEIVYYNKVVGYVEVYTNDYDLKKSIRNTIFRICMQTLFISPFLVIIIFFSLKIIILNPIINLKNVIGSFSNKNFSVRSDLKSEDEIGSLSFVFNRMADTIQKHNNQLVELVEERTKELVQAEKMASLGGMVAGVAHEINTPLGVSITAISHLAGLTREICEIFEDNKIKKSDFEHYLQRTIEAADIILVNLQRTSDLVKNFKLVAVDQSTEIKRQFKVKEYIESVLMSLNPKLKPYSLNIVINCDDHLAVNSYPGAFYQILTNLIMNSLLHGFDMMPSGSITMDIEDKYGDIYFSYKDNGKGIPEDIIEKIYDPFFTTKRAHGGTGLGLNIVYNLVAQKLSGTIKCSNLKPSGVEFLIIFPDK